MAVVRRCRHKYVLYMHKRFVQFISTDKPQSYLRSQSLCCFHIVAGITFARANSETRCTLAVQQQRSFQCNFIIYMPTI